MVYEKAKKIAGESVSSVLIQGLKDFVVKWEMQEFGFNEVQLFEGEEYYRDQYSKGQYFKFSGKQLAEATVEHVQGVSTVYKLYLSRKGKFLLYITFEDLNKDMCRSSKEIYDTIGDMKGKDLPPELFSQADKSMPNLFVEVLDI